MQRPVLTISIIISLIILAFAAYILFPVFVPQSKDRVAFSVIDRGVRSNWTEQANFRIDSEEDFANLWEAIHGESTTKPSIDFDREFVIVAFLGVRETEGHGVTIAEIRNTEEYYTVVVREETPGEGCIRTPAALTPYVIARVPRGSHEGAIPLESIVISERTACTL